MRIVYTSDILSIHDRRFLLSLSESGHDVTLVTYYPGPQLPAEVSGLEGVRIIHEWIPPRFSSRRYVGVETALCFLEHLVSRASTAGASPLGGATGDGRRRLARRLYGAQATRHLQELAHFRRVLPQLRPDVVHAGWVQTSGARTALAGVRPWLLMPWGSDILLLPDESWQKRTLTQFAIDSADAITCDCEAVRRRIVELSGYPAERITVMPWGIDLELFRPRDKDPELRERFDLEGQNVLIMTRSLAPVYGIEFFLRALPRVFEAHPATRALLLGSGPLDTELRSLAQELGLGDRVHFVGAVPNREIARFLNAADVYVSSSLSDGTSLSLLEAMASGLPVVVTDVAAYLEWVTDGVNGAIVPRRDPGALAEAIAALLSDPSRARALGQRNLALARERADWKKNFATLVALYDRLVVEHRAGSPG